MKGGAIVQKSKDRAAIYIRVSTDAQREEGYSIDAQKEMLEAFCISKQIKDFEFYIDGGFSGSNLERPEMQRLINDVKEHKVNFVIVYKLDRLSRSQKDTLFLIEDVFNPNNVNFVSLKETMDTSTPLGRLMLGILSAFAQLERENIRERTRMGMKERVKSGLWMGGGRVPFGYDYDKKKGVLVPNDDAITVRKIYDLYLQGHSLGKIAQMVGLKYEKLALQILTRKSNTGVICYNDEEYQGQHLPIISTETYEKAMDMMKSRSIRGVSSSNYLLTGLIFCKKCGAKMRYQKWGKFGYKIWCYSQDKSKPHLVKDPNCDCPKVWADEIEKVVIESVWNFGIELDKKDIRKEKIYNALDMLNEQYTACANKIKRLYNLYAQSDDDLLLQTIESNQKDLKCIANQIKIEKERGVLTAKSNKLRDDVKNLKNTWDLMTDKEKQTIMRSLIKKISFDGYCVDIEFNI
jgi:site-specific DNA recombinase